MEFASVPGDEHTLKFVQVVLESLYVKNFQNYVIFTGKIGMIPYPMEKCCNISVQTLGLSCWN